MEWKIPYFEYDLFARIAPGALTIAVLQYLGMPMPAYWKPLLPLWKDTLLPDAGMVAFGGITLLGASYAIGLIYESLSPLLWRRLPRTALVRAAVDQKTRWRRPVVGPSALCNEKDLFKTLLQWLVCTRDPDVRSAFVHMHRFQAEARLCAYSVAPLIVLGVAAFVKQEAPHGAWIWAPSFFIALLLVICTISRERRRWIQAIAILDELRPEKDNDIGAELQRALQNLSDKAPKASILWSRARRIALPPTTYAVLIRVTLTRDRRKAE